MISNRQSAARSREKMRYVGELERKEESLQKEETALFVHLSNSNVYFLQNILLDFRKFFGA